MHTLEKINRKLYRVLLSVTAFVLFTRCATNKGSTSNGKLIMQEQGSFAVGGTVVTNPGTCDPIKHGAYNPVSQPSEGQTLHGDHSYVFYQIPNNARQLPLVFWHGHGQSAKTWKQLAMVMKVSRTFSYVANFQFTLLTNEAG
ncbi:MAG: alpha/beta hydrolase [Segetibacter sp.]|nr:alpha/beta hydrolase [Segetibacter sp.]